MVFELEILTVPIILKIGYAYEEDLFCLSSLVYEICPYGSTKVEPPCIYTLYGEGVFSRANFPTSKYNFTIGYIELKFEIFIDQCLKNACAKFQNNRQLTLTATLVSIFTYSKFFTLPS